MEQDPHFADSPRQQGQVYFLWGFSELASARPAAAARLISRARQILVSAIQASAAREDYSEALALSVNLEHYLPLPPALHRERGLWLLLLGRRSEALVELRAAQAAMPDDARVQALIEEAQK
jgi:regulator of sirC expression with transglutaminase-like and TPR domain